MTVSIHLRYTILLIFLDMRHTNFLRTSLSKLDQEVLTVPGMNTFLFMKHGCDFWIVNFVVNIKQFGTVCANIPACVHLVKNISIETLNNICK